MLLQTPGPTPTPTYVPVVASIDQPIGIAIGSSTADRASVVLAKAMTAQESADKTHELGFGSIPMIAPADWKCPDGADCPYPGEPGGDHGYLIITRLSGALNPGGSIHVAVNWISDMSSRETVPDAVMSESALQ